MSRKSYPFNYPEDVKRVIDAMIIPGGRLEVAGSVADAVYVVVLKGQMFKFRINWKPFL